MPSQVPCPRWAPTLPGQGHTHRMPVGSSPKDQADSLGTSRRHERRPQSPAHRRPTSATAPIRVLHPPAARADNLGVALTSDQQAGLELRLARMLAGSQPKS